MRKYLVLLVLSLVVLLSGCDSNDVADNIPPDVPKETVKSYVEEKLPQYSEEVEEYYESEFQKSSQFIYTLPDKLNDEFPIEIELLDKITARCQPNSDDLRSSFIIEYSLADPWNFMKQDFADISMYSLSEFLYAYKESEVQSVRTDLSVEIYDQNRNILVSFFILLDTMDDGRFTPNYYNKDLTGMFYNYDSIKVARAPESEKSTDIYGEYVYDRDTEKLILFSSYFPFDSREPTEKYQSSYVY